VDYTWETEIHVGGYAVLGSVVAHLKGGQRESRTRGETLRGVDIGEPSDIWKQALE
jgi:hypothetical protein